MFVSEMFAILKLILHKIFKYVSFLRVTTGPFVVTWVDVKFQDKLKAANKTGLP